MTSVLEELTGASSFKWTIPQGTVGNGTECTAYLGNDDSNLALQILIVPFHESTPVSKGSVQSVYNAYRGKKTFPLLVILNCTEHENYLYGPIENSTLKGPFNESHVYRIASAALEKEFGVEARQWLVQVLDAHTRTQMLGISNSGLFSSHYIKTSASTRNDWKIHANLSEKLVKLKDRELISGLGFRIHPNGSTSLLLSSENDTNRALAILLERSETFDSTSARFPISPVADGLVMAQQKEVPWLVVIKGSRIRLYSTKLDHGVGRRGQTETFFELDLATIDKKYEPLLTLVFSEAALSPSGTTEDLLSESSRFAVALGTRLRERVYNTAVPRLSIAVANAIKDQDIALDRQGLDLSYSITLRIIFRILFQAYAEDSSLLPYGKNDNYDRHSLKIVAQDLSKTEIAKTTDASTSRWNDLKIVWKAVNSGDQSLGVPAYDGGLFGEDDVEGQLLSKIEIDNSTMNIVLDQLLVDSSDNNSRGPVDFRSLSVREFGTIYEGLLSSSLSVADVDLAVNKDQEWVEAKLTDKVLAKVGEPYLHNTSGARKSSGSYFTPAFIVDHIIEKSIGPAIEAHFTNIKQYLESGEEVKAGEEFFDFRVGDLAMGSGHFLISSIDFIETKMTTFLRENPITGVNQELLNLAKSAATALGDLAEEENMSSLLRRQIARRCIYGIDINNIAVELAKVAIWIHTFVPGLPMSTLDHSLVCGNSLTGLASMEEFQRFIDPSKSPGKQKSEGQEVGLYSEEFSAHLDKAKQLLIEASYSQEATIQDVKDYKTKLKEFDEATKDLTKRFNAIMALRAGLVKSYKFNQDSFAQEADTPEVKKAVSILKPIHFPLAFPEVFLRPDPGFDVLIGNPPWEKLKVDEKIWWGMRIPKLRSMPMSNRLAAIESKKNESPNLRQEFNDELEISNLLRDGLKFGNFPGIGSGDIDLYQAFAWQNFFLVRPKGMMGLVLPGVSLTGSGLKLWRRTILTTARYELVTRISNKGGWVFPDVDERYSIALAILKQDLGDYVNLNGPFTSKTEFVDRKNDFLSLATSDLISWSTTCTFPRLETSKALEIFLQMRKSPEFRNFANSNFRPIAELHPTNDKQYFDTDLNIPISNIRVLTGGSLGLWNPDFGPPYAYARDTAIPYLESKLKRQTVTSSSAFFGKKIDKIIRPWSVARIVYRDVTNSTNSRTAIAALIPPNTLLTGKAPYLYNNSGNCKLEAYLLGVMSSHIFDWYARKVVELDLTFELLNSIPVPEYNAESPLTKRIITISGTLASKDKRFNVWANEVGVEIGTVRNDIEKQHLTDELDAVVALLYGLDESQLTHIFETFHPTWEFGPSLNNSLNYYHQWKSQI